MLFQLAMALSDGKVRMGEQKPLSKIIFSGSQNDCLVRVLSWFLFVWRCFTARRTVCRLGGVYGWFCYVPSRLRPE